MLAIYKENYQQEKVHIHFDKGLYAKGETIWGKAYILAGEGLSDYSRNFYADWYDDAGQLIKHTVHPIFESSAKLQFEIPQNYKGTHIRVKAYTRWMLNFDAAFIFTKDITIQGSDSLAGTKKVEPIYKLQFFPEGGQLITGLQAQVGFLSVNQNGDPAPIKGAIFNSNLVLMDSIQSVHDGMGVFSFIPEKDETYNCIWVDAAGTVHTTAVPVAKSDGIVMQALLQDDKAKIVIQRPAVTAQNFLQLHVVASMNQRMVYTSNIQLQTKKSAALTMRTDSLPTGVLQITVFDATWVPVAERVLFINNNLHTFYPSVKMFTPRLSKRAKNTIDIVVEDTLLSNLSVSVTDINAVQDNSNTIFSNLLLQGDIKGNIPNAAQYFSSTDADMPAKLDLVMLTHGWRKYNWEEMIKGKLPNLKYQMDSDYLQIRGAVYNGASFDNKLVKSITMVLQSKDSSKQYFFAPINPDASFSQRGIIFFDTVRVFYKINGDKKIAPSTVANFTYSLPTVMYPTQIQLYHFAKPDTTGLSYLMYMEAQAKRIKKTFDSVVILKEVVVQSKAKSAIDVLDEKYTTGLFSSRDSYAFDVQNDGHATGATNVFQYLQNLIPGMTMSIPILGANGAEDANSNNVPGLNWRDGTPDIFLNEMLSDAEQTMGIQMSDIAYIKVFRPPFMGSSGSGPSGAIAIYTKKPADLKNESLKGLSNAILTGYTNYKEFYSPNYLTAPTKVPDVRTTLYWNPYVLTDKKTKLVKLDFYNNDVTTKFRIVVEGMNAAGKLTRVEKIIQ
ncbi:MAG: hypothetical protein WBH12_01605 [Sediminibacterium sp.]